MLNGRKLASLRQTAVLHAKIPSPLYAPPLRRGHPVCFHPHDYPALTGGREAEDGGQAYETADCLSEASFLPFSLNAGRSSPTGTAGALSFW